jgi:hypothetical protein
MIGYTVLTSDGVAHDIEAVDEAAAARLILRAVAEGLYVNPSAPNHDVVVVTVARRATDPTFVRLLPHANLDLFSSKYPRAWDGDGS